MTSRNVTSAAVLHNTHSLIYFSPFRNNSMIQPGKKRINYQEYGQHLSTIKDLQKTITAKFLELHKKR
jgi:hypothetical protein